MVYDWLPHPPRKAAIRKTTQAKQAILRDVRNTALLFVILFFSFVHLTPL